VIIEEQFADVIEEQRVAVDGVVGQVLTGGEGPPVVLLHGDGDSPAVWQRVFPALTREHRVFAPGLPGHSDTDKPQIDYSREYMTDFMSRFLDALGIDRCVLIGNSLGGQVAIHLTLAEPERFPALVLLDSSGLGWEVNPSLALETLPFAGELATAFARSPFGGALRQMSRVSELFWRKDRAPASWLEEQRRLALLPGFLDAAIAAKRAVIAPWGQREVLLDQLHRLPMPALVVWGANDLVLPVAHAHQAMDRLPNGELALIPDCGHMAHVERPDEFLSALLPFLAAHREQVPAAATAQTTERK
jgi:4,5:9,10-diseco-3-hydroxy-5,9,17-trioxoandrosta-1(10),2-diene-4-oate hydrolase